MNITQGTINVIQILVHDAFDINASLDRIKTVLNTTLAFPITGNLIHKVAHKYALNIGDGVGDLIERYNIPVEYGGIERHVEDYTNIYDAMHKALDLAVTYQNELNKSAKIISDNMDFHVYKGLLDVISEHNTYVEQLIQWVDIVDRYGDSASLDVHMQQYTVEGML